MDANELVSQSRGSSAVRGAGDVEALAEVQTSFRMRKEGDHGDSGCVWGGCWSWSRPSSHWAKVELHQRQDEPPVCRWATRGGSAHTVHTRTHTYGSVRWFPVCLTNMWLECGEKLENPGENPGENTGRTWQPLSQRVSCAEEKPLSMSGLSG